MVRRSLVGLLRSLGGKPDDRGPRASAPSSYPAPPTRDWKLRHLSAIDVFSDLTPDDLDWLAARTTMVTARRGQIVYMPGETSEALFLLKAGRVQIYRLSADGKKLVLSNLGPETFFGDMPLAGQQMYGAYAETTDDCTICVLGRADLERLITTRPQVALRLLEATGRRLVDAEAAIEAFAFKSVSVRLATLLLRLADREAGMLVGHTHQELAEMVGTYRETVTQALDEFRRRGLVELGRKQLRIVDRHRLEEIAGS